MTARRAILFSSVDEVIAEVERLRTAPCTQLGNWSLEQACWHLNFVLTYSISPCPHNVPETSRQARDDLNRILAGGQILNGIRSPDPGVPPKNCGPDAIDSLIGTLKRLNRFDGSFAPHRLFGSLTPSEGRQLAMIHCAHHLSYLVPVSELNPTA